MAKPGATCGQMQHSTAHRLSIENRESRIKDVNTEETIDRRTPSHGPRPSVDLPSSVTTSSPLKYPVRNQRPRSHEQRRDSGVHGHKRTARLETECGNRRPVGAGVSRTCHFGASLSLSASARSLTQLVLMEGTSLKSEPSVSWRLPQYYQTLPSVSAHR